MDLKLPEDATLDEQQLSLADTLIEKLTTDFQPDSYHDPYVEQINQLIAQKAEGRVQVEEGTEPEPTPVADLMEMLKKSLEREPVKAA